VHTTEHDDVSVSFPGLKAEAERITHEIGEILNLWDLVVVSQDDRVALPLQLQDFGGQIITFFESNHLLKIINPPCLLRNREEFWIADCRFRIFAWSPGLKLNPKSG
jgi:hypothetical protein